MYDINRVGQDILCCPVMWVMESPIKYLSLELSTLLQSSLGGARAVEGVFRKDRTSSIRNCLTVNIIGNINAIKRRGKIVKDFEPFYFPSGSEA